MSALMSYVFQFSGVSASDLQYMFEMSLKCSWQEVEELYYLCSKSKDADQLLGYCAAEFHLCFRICFSFLMSLPWIYSTCLRCRLNVHGGK